MNSIALLCLLVSGTFLIFANEPLWSRTLTFVVIGIIPSLICYGSGWLVYRIFQALDPVCDRIAARALLLYGMLAKVAQTYWRLTMQLINLGIEAMALRLRAARRSVPLVTVLMFARVIS